MTHQRTEDFKYDIVNMLMMHGLKLSPGELSGRISRVEEEDEVAEAYLEIQTHGEIYQLSLRPCYRGLRRCESRPEELDARHLLHQLSNSSLGDPPY